MGNFADLSIKELYYKMLDTLPTNLDQMSKEEIENQFKIVEKIEDLILDKLGFTVYNLGNNRFLVPMWNYESNTKYLTVMDLYKET